jgi:hypothetical protein
MLKLQINWLKIKIWLTKQETIKNDFLPPALSTRSNDRPSIKINIFNTEDKLEY